MAALSGLTPALSRRLQQQLLAHLPPAAARSLRRTLSLHAAPPPAATHAHHAPHAPNARQRAHRSHSASKYNEPTNSDVLDRLVPVDDKQPRTPTPKPDTKSDLEEKNANDRDMIRDDAETKGVQRRYLRGHSVISIDNDTSKDNTPEQNIDGTISHSPKNDPKRVDDLIADNEKLESINRNDDMDLATSSHVAQFCTLPRLKRSSVTSRDSTSPSSVADSVGCDFTSKSFVGKDTTTSRSSSIRNSQDRPLLSKYLIPDRHLSLDETYSSDTGSIISEPSYIAAYGTSSLGNTSGLSFRRHSMRLPGDQPRKRISRFLRSDFYDTPPDDSLYAKHKKEKELETQKILKEIREKKNRSLDSPKSPVESNETVILNKDDSAYPRKCLSPVGNLLSRERSRSTTPFFPILDNIKETNLDTSLTTDSKRNAKKDLRKSSLTEEKLQNKESKMARPKSYPVKSFNSLDETSKTRAQETTETTDCDSEERKLTRQSKLIRPKSYPASTPSPEKNVSNKCGKKDDFKESLPSKEENNMVDNKTDVEVSFSFTLPKKKSLVTKSETTTKHTDLSEQKMEFKQEAAAPTLVLKKYKVVPNENADSKILNNTHAGNGTIVDNATLNGSVVEDNTKLVGIKKSDSDPNKKTVKKKIIKKVSSKSKTDVIDCKEPNDGTNSTDKKKVVKKAKEKSNEDSKSTTTVKKKSVLQSIGHKLEKLASSKSNSPEKSSQSSIASKDLKKEGSKLNRLQREQSVPVESDPPTESNLIKRAVTLTDVAALDSQNVPQSKTTVSKVLGLFKKFESKEKNSKSIIENSASEDSTMSNSKNHKYDTNTETNVENEKDKPKRPTSLLLNGLGRKNKYNKSASDSASVVSLEIDEQPVLKKDREPKGVRNTLKLDFSKLPRVKKIVPTNPVIEPQIMNVSSTDKENEKKNILEKYQSITDSNDKNDTNDTHSRSRSRSRSIYSNSDIKSEHSAEIKLADKLSETFTGSSAPRLRNKDSISPEKEDIVDRIRRKSFYSRFNEKKQRRKSSLVGPGATEYDPVARLHSQPSETKLDVSPSSPINYDLSPGYSIASDLSPSTDRYRSLLTDLPSARGLRYDGVNEKVDTYRSLDRNDFRKYSSGRSYLDYDQAGTYGGHRYSRTKSLLENCDEDQGLSHLRDPVKYSRTNSLYTPGNYATYRPKRTRNSAIILKESEKEPSPENILEKIRNRKISISVTRKPDSEDSLPRSNVSSKSEGDGAERSEKTD